MKLATLRVPGGTVAVRVEGEAGIELPGVADVGELLRSPDYAAIVTADGPRHTLADADWAPVVPRPGKMFCVGVNYRAHIAEMGREPAEHPTLFAKFPEALIGPYDAIALPPESSEVDWEAELAVVIGTRVRRASAEEAEAAIAGYSVVNDVTMRDFQYRTLQWLQGKTWEASAPFGPVLVTPDEFTLGAQLTGEVDGERVQSARTDDLVFGPVELVQYISTIVTLNPGDVIATGTPGGVGHARKPARYLQAGDVLVTEVEGIGRLENTVVAEEV
jgi:acylpyruvate hydrolase